MYSFNKLAANFVGYVKQFELYLRNDYYFYSLVLFLSVLFVVSLFRFYNKKKSLKILRLKHNINKIRTERIKVYTNQIKIGKKTTGEIELLNNIRKLTHA